MSRKPFLEPSRRRWVILVLIFLVMVLTYIDRQIISVLKPILKAEFHIDDGGYALLINAFTVCYAAFYPMAGWLADRFGAGKMILVEIVAWAGICFGTMLTRTFGQLALLRGTLGVVEPLVFPAQLRVVTVWFPSTLRATANSVCAAGSTVGAIVAPALAAWLALSFGWRAAFVVPGCVGVIVAVLWRVIYRDPPKEISADIPALDKTEAFTWPQLWRTRSLWGIVLVRFVSDPVWYFCLFWLPGYLQEKSGLSLAQVGLFGWIPFLVADLGGIGSSMLSDGLVRRGTAPLQARKLVLGGAAMVAPLCILTPWLPNPAMTLVIFSLVGAVCLTWLFNLGVVVAETFPAPNVGSVWGIAAAFGATGAIIFNSLVGHLMQSLGSTRIFILMAFLHPVATLLLWTMVRRERPAGPSL